MPHLLRFCFSTFIYLLLLRCKSERTSEKMPTVMVAILVRNKAHALPNVLGALDMQDYPDDRISIWIREDHSTDDSADVLQTWEANSAERPSYHSIDVQVDRSGPSTYPEENSPLEWTNDRFKRVMELREEALSVARRMWTDRLLLMDADVVLSNITSLRHLVENSENRAVVAPLLNCTTEKEYHSNFWGAMTKDGYYQRSEDYFLIKRREMVGIYAVPMVHTAMMINLRLKDSDLVEFSPPTTEQDNTPLDDMVTFGLRARERNLPLYIDNTMFYGYHPLPVPDRTLPEEVEQFKHLRIEMMLETADYFMNQGAREDKNEVPIVGPPVAPALQKWVKPRAPHRHGFDRIYLVNLARRPDRRQKMEYCFRELAINAHYWEAVDGKKLNVTYLSSLGIRQLPGYADPYHGRGLTMGEVGCFLSHMTIWEELVADPSLQKVLIFEDDIRFDPLFESTLRDALKELEDMQPDWDILYLGRKIMLTNETMLEGATYLAKPEYTYWTLSYAISKKGAQKLLAQEPLKKMVAVDEFLPIMFDRHPYPEWKKFFGPRNLTVLTVAPLLVQPTHYHGEKHYRSDTEASVVLCQEGKTKDSRNGVSGVGISLGLCGDEKEILKQLARTTGNKEEL